jgi:hypothetical protein
MCPYLNIPSCQIPNISTIEFWYSSILHEICPVSKEFTNTYMVPYSTTLAPGQSTAAANVYGCYFTLSVGYVTMILVSVFVLVVCSVGYISQNYDYIRSFGDSSETKSLLFKFSKTIKVENLDQEFKENELNLVSIATEVRE